MRASASVMVRWALLGLAIGAAVVARVDPVAGQSRRVVPAGTQGNWYPPEHPLPAKPAGTPSKTWKPAMLPDGQPDVQGGLWGPVVTGTHNPLENPTGGKTQVPSRIADPPDGKVPYQPWALKLRENQPYNRDNPTKPWHIDTQQRCLYAPPRMGYGTEQYRIIQPPGYVVFVWNRNHEFRVIPVSPDKYVNPGPRLKTWMGFSRGHWEGTTLVVENINHRGILLSSLGDFITDKTKFTERWQFLDGDNINWEVTIEDPAIFTRPWTMRNAHRRGKDILGNQGGEGAGDEFWEEACYEGTTSVEHELFNNIFSEK